MKYMLMMFGEAAGMEERYTAEQIKDMFAFMERFDQELRDAGELVFDMGLTDGSTAKLVDFQNGRPVVTSGPFVESERSLIGYWVVDVVDEARALELAGRVVEVIEEPVEVRRAQSEPPEF